MFIVFVRQMFNVSALLLGDEALKCVVTIISFSVSFKTRDISQANVATHLRCCRIFTDSIITDFFLMLTENEFENGQHFDEVKTYEKIVPILDQGKPAQEGSSNVYNTHIASFASRERGNWRHIFRSRIEYL